MTAFEMIELLQHHIDTGAIDADDPIHIPTGHSTREVVHVTLQEHVHWQALVMTQRPLVEGKNLEHPPEGL